MAEIHVEKKRGSMKWLWFLVLLIVLALLAWWLWQSGMFAGEADTLMPGDTISLLRTAPSYMHA